MDQTRWQRAVEWVAWRFIWATHSPRWHQMHETVDPSLQWCADCLMFYRKKEPR